MSKNSKKNNNSDLESTKPNSPVKKSVVSRDSRPDMVKVEITSATVLNHKVVKANTVLAVTEKRAKALFLSKKAKPYFDEDSNDDASNYVDETDDEGSANE